MNLEVRTKDLFIKITNGDVNRVERALVAVFEYIEGGKFSETFENALAEERPVNSKRNFTPTIDGVKIVNGVSVYQVAYHCSCGDIGQRFVPKDSVVCTCHACKGTLTLQPASDEGQRDKDDNYFVAY